MTNYGDRRTEPRKIVMAFTPVYDFKSGKILGYLRDLTMKGTQVNGGKKLDVNSMVTLSIELPDDLPVISSKRINIEARVARCSATLENPNSFETGFEFKNITPEQVTIIELLLERYHFRHKME